MTINEINRSAARKPSHRSGTITILSAFLAIALLGMVALSVDVGYILSAKEELQRTADSAALAACGDFALKLSRGYASGDAVTSARVTANQYAGLNPVGNQGPELDLASGNSANSDIVFGYIGDIYDSNAVMDTSATDFYNVTRVRVRRHASINGEVPLFFARIFGLTGQQLEAEATAALVRDIGGFRARSDGRNLDILPIALDLDTYVDWMAGSAADSWTWNEETEAISAGADGVLEVNLYPQGTGSPGNRGMVDIGSSNNSTNDIARQIIHGISGDDLAHHGGTLEFDANGELFLNGDTGISAGVKDELAAIKGQPRIIPIFSEVNGPGNNAMYTIVKWLGIRIMDVKLTGPMNKKHLTIQVAPVETKGVIPSSTTGTSQYVYSPVVLLK